MKKLFLVSLLLFLMLGLSVPAFANIELILAPEGWRVGDAPAEIWVLPSTEFTLQLGIQVMDDQTMAVEALDLDIWYDPILEEAIPGGPLVPNAYFDVGPVRDGNYLAADWFTVVDQYFYWNDITRPGWIEYELNQPIGTVPVTVGAGYYPIGDVVFHCLEEGVSQKTPGGTFWGEKNGNWKEHDFDSIHGTIVNQVIPEPATMLLLGTGLLGLVAGLRKRKS